MTTEEAKEIMCKVTFYWELGEQTLTQNQINEAIDLAIKALGQQPCEDCISRAEVLKILEKEEFKGDAIYEIEKKLPSVTPTRPTGKWIDIGDEGLVFKCSICGTKKTIESHFCPNCGTRLEVEDEADN